MSMCLQGPHSGAGNCSSLAGGATPASSDVSLDSRRRLEGGSLPFSGLSGCLSLGSVDCCVCCCCCCCLSAMSRCRSAFARFFASFSCLRRWSSASVSGLSSAHRDLAGADIFAVLSLLLLPVCSSSSRGYGVPDVRPDLGCSARRIRSKSPSTAQDRDITTTPTESAE